MGGITRSVLPDCPAGQSVHSANSAAAQIICCKWKLFGVNIGQWQQTSTNTASMAEWQLISSDRIMLLTKKEKIKNIMWLDESRHIGSGEWSIDRAL